MSPRRKALLEAALLCSRYADNLHELPNGFDVATECSKMIWKLAESDVHSYPPGKRVIDRGQVSENSSRDISGSC